MQRLARIINAVVVSSSGLLEVAGLTLLAIGLHDVFEPLGLIFAGAALVFLAQGMERHE